MREIKFRAWYGNEMVNVGQLDFFTDGQVHVNNELVGAILQQYTGLKDKNGKEIYEGDVVITPGRGVFIVEWNSFKEVKKSVIAVESFSDSEVAGNIYENPELCLN